MTGELKEIYLTGITHAKAKSKTNRSILTKSRIEFLKERFLTPSPAE
jgi:hypothetical protein